MRTRLLIAAWLLSGCQFSPAGLGTARPADADAGPVNGDDAGPGRDTDAAPPGTPDAAAPGTPDAAPADAAACPKFCTSCNLVAGTCVVDCSDSTCSSGITVDCPPGWSCRVDCVGDQACRDGAVSCSGTCEIVCMGAQACESGGVSCDGADCTVRCDGQDACDLGVRCDASACSILCNGPAACEDEGVCCGGASCGADCVATGGGSCACP